MNGGLGEETYNDTVFAWDSFYTGISTWKISWLCGRINYSKSKALVYDLSEVYKKDYINFSQVLISLRFSPYIIITNGDSAWQTLLKFFNPGHYLFKFPERY